MRFVLCAQSWHSFDDLHRYLLLMMDFDCPLAFRHKKGSTFSTFGTLVEFFVLRGRYIYCFICFLFHCLLIYIYELFIDICLYFVLSEIKN